MECGKAVNIKGAGSSPLTSRRGTHRKEWVCHRKFERQRTELRATGLLSTGPSFLIYRQTTQSLQY
jgi:hypothetical protein